MLAPSRRGRACRAAGGLHGWLLAAAVLALLADSAAAAGECYWAAQAGECSRTCGGGLQLLTFHCSCADAARCLRSPMPDPVLQSCNAQPCTYCPTLQISDMAMSSAVGTGSRAALACPYCQRYNRLAVNSFFSADGLFSLVYDESLRGWALRHTSSPPLLEAFLPAPKGLEPGPAAPDAAVAWRMPTMQGDGSILSFRDQPTLTAICINCADGTDAADRQYYTPSTKGTCMQVRSACQSPERELRAPTATSDRLCQVLCQSPLCDDCLPTNASVCRRCAAGFFLWQGQCLTSCPAEAPVVDVENRRCRPCAPGEAAVVFDGLRNTVVCQPCSNASCYACDAPNLATCTACHIDETLQNFTCQPSTQTVRLTLGVSPAAFDQVALEDRLRQVLGTYARVTMQQRVTLGAVDHVQVLVVACNTASLSCLSPTILTQRLNDDLVRSALEAALGYSYNTEGQIVRSSSNESDAGMPISRSQLILIAACGGAGLLVLIAAVAMILRSRRRGGHKSAGGRPFLRRGKHHDDIRNGLEFEENPFNDYSGESDEYIARYSDILRWFRNSELVSGVGLSRSHHHLPWFCGIIAGRKAEAMLQGTAAGTFLVRVHRRKPCYVLSLSVQGGCLHFPIHVSPEHFYYLLHKRGGGLHHPSLQDLIAYHRRHPVLANCRLRYPTGDKGRSFGELIHAITRMESYSTHSSGMTGRHSGSDKALLIDIPDMAAGNDADSGSEADCDLDIEEPIYESLAVLQQDPPSEVIYAELPAHRGVVRLEREEPVHEVAPAELRREQAIALLEAADDVAAPVASSMPQELNAVEDGRTVAALQSSPEPTTSDPVLQSQAFTTPAAASCESSPAARRRLRYSLAGRNDSQGSDLFRSAVVPAVSCDVATEPSDQANEVNLNENKLASAANLLAASRDSSLRRSGSLPDLAVHHRQSTTTSSFYTSGDPSTSGTTGSAQFRSLSSQKRPKRLRKFRASVGDRATDSQYVLLPPGPLVPPTGAANTMSSGSRLTVPGGSRLEGESSSPLSSPDSTPIRLSAPRRSVRASRDRAPSLPVATTASPAFPGAHVSTVPVMSQSSNVNHTPVQLRPPRPPPAYRDVMARHHSSIAPPPPYYPQLSNRASAHGLPPPPQFPEPGHARDRSAAVSAMAIMDESGNWRVVYQRPAAARTTSSRLSAPQLRYPTALGGTLHSMEETA